MKHEVLNVVRADVIHEVDILQLFVVLTQPLEDEVDHLTHELATFAAASAHRAVFAVHWRLVRVLRTNHLRLESCPQLFVNLHSDLEWSDALTERMLLALLVEQTRLQ